MSNLIITNIDLGSVIYKDAEFRDEILEILAADTILEGTLLARKTVQDAVADGVPDGGNTGNGTVTLVTVVPGTVVPLVGIYTLTNEGAIPNGGIFTLRDPNGAIVGSRLAMTVGAGVSTVFEVAGLQFTITDAATDFAIGDFFSLTILANGKMVLFSITGAGGAQIAIEILTYEVITTAAENVAIRAGVSGSYRKERLVIDGTGPGIGLTDEIFDQLRDFGLVPIDSQDLSILDNQ